MFKNDVITYSIMWGLNNVGECHIRYFGACVTAPEAEPKEKHGIWDCDWDPVP
jgi:hypothetical protein